MSIFDYVGTILLVFLILEFALQVAVNYLRRDFQWLINKHDEYPSFNPEALKKFFNNSFDKELGWVRKADSSGIEHGEFGDIRYHIDKYGSRKNIVEGSASVVTFGDSYTFCRQVEDDQTWQVFFK